MKKVSIAVTITFILVSCMAFASDLKLSGKWRMSYDPDGPVVEDWMVFNDNGSVDFADKKGTYASCSYGGVGNAVMIVCNVRGKEKKAVFKARNDFKELVNPSGAIYSKVE